MYTHKNEQRLIRQTEEGKDIHTGRGDRDQEAEIRFLRLSAKKHQRLTAATRNDETKYEIGFPPKPLVRVWPC